MFLQLNAKNLVRTSCLSADRQASKRIIARSNCINLQA